MRAEAAGPRSLVLRTCGVHKRPGGGGAVLEVAPDEAWRHTQKVGGRPNARHSEGAKAMTSAIFPCSMRRT
jgi:hypothetical protein